jgi:uncharacterized protein YjbI with pentapeptide repeats
MIAAVSGSIDPPDLPDLEPTQLTLDDSGALVLDGALVTGPSDTPSAEPLRATRVVVKESEFSGVTFRAPAATALELRDVRLRGCDLSNVEAPDPSIWRVDVADSRLLGFRAAGGDVRELRVTDSSLVLATFAFARMRNVVFEGVDLTEASFMEARLDRVEFVDCRLADTDFRGATVNACAIRGSSLDGVLGIESLRGIRMPWNDIVASVAALAAGLGIQIESEDDALA